MNMYSLSSRYHHPLLEKQTDIFAVNRSWHTSTRWQLIANTRAIWRNMWLTHRTDFCLSPEHLWKQMRVVMFGMRFSTLLWLSILLSIFIEFSILWVLRWVARNVLLTLALSIHSTPFSGTFSASRKKPPFPLRFPLTLQLFSSGSFPQTQVSPLYFDREDVKKAIHAPDTTWTECSNVDVFPTGDQSLPSSLSVLPNVIEKSNRTVIVHGLADFVLIAEGWVFPLCWFDGSLCPAL